jgi:hypothetical protein
VCCRLGRSWQFPVNIVELKKYEVGKPSTSPDESGQVGYHFHCVLTSQYVRQGWLSPRMDLCARQALQSLWVPTRSTPASQQVRILHVCRSPLPRNVLLTINTHAEKTSRGPIVNPGQLLRTVCVVSSISAASMRSALQTCLTTFLSAPSSDFEYVLATAPRGVKRVAP